jgi:hypothetical protein
MAARSTLTPLARQNLVRAALAVQTGSGTIISRDQADRPSLAALHSRGLLCRSIRRQGRNAADNAYEYRLTLKGAELVLELVKRDQV